MKKRELTFIITALILGAVVGGLLGDVVATFLPEGAAKTVFSKSIQIGFSPVKVDFFVLSFTVGAMFRVNFMSALFLLLVIIYFRWWYL